MPSIWLTKSFFTPVPIEVSRMTEATPMIDAEHRERGAELVGAQRAQRDAEALDEVHAATSFSARALGASSLGREDAVFDALVGDDEAVSDADDPLGVLRHAVVVRDEHDGDALGVQLLQHRHDLDAATSSPGCRSARRRARSRAR